MRRIAYFTYHRKDDNVLETAIKSLRAVSACEIVIATDGVPEDLRQSFIKDYRVEWDVVEPARMEKRRATCKIERLEFLVDSVEDGTQIGAFDVDTYFLKDAFMPFELHPEMDLGLTTRGYEYWAPINAGVFYLRCNRRVQTWLAWHLAEIYGPLWKPYVEIRKRMDHERLGLDWTVSQDFLVACWQHREAIQSLLGLRIEDVGPEYNFCPPADYGLQEAKAKIRKTYSEKSVSILHLKSDLKQLAYEGLFEHAVTCHERGPSCWL